MKRFAVAALVAFCGCSALVVAQGFKANRHDPWVEDLNDQNEPPMLGVHWARDFAPAHGARTRDPNMTYHGGKIMPTVVSKAIFWGTSWANASFAGDKISGIDIWYTGHDGSNYAKTVDEYTGTNGQVGSNGLTHQGHVVDTSTASGGIAYIDNSCRGVQADQRWKHRRGSNGNGYYPVYSDVKRGNAGYCAWHSVGTCNGTPVQFAFFFNLDGDAGCDPRRHVGPALAGPRGAGERDWARNLGGAVRSGQSWRLVRCKAVPRTATSARGPSGRPWSRLRVGASGRFRGSGRTKPIPPALVTRIPPAKRDA